MHNSHCPHCRQPLLAGQAHACAAGEEKDPTITALRARGLDRVWWGKFGAQQPTYTPVAKKTQGSFPGAIYTKDHTNPASLAGMPLKQWIGKVGSYDNKTTLDTLQGSAQRRGISRDAIKEKIAFDCYLALAHSCQDAYLVPKCRLAQLPIINDFTRENAWAQAIQEELNQQSQRSRSPDARHVHIMSKMVVGYQDLKDAHVLFQGNRLPFMTYFEQTGCFPEAILHGNDYLPLQGLSELLAASRLLADIDVFGYGTNVGYVITQNNRGRRQALVVKVDPGFAFTFTPQNRLYALEFPHRNPRMRQQEKSLVNAMDIQFMAQGGAISWVNFSANQQNHFLRALQHGITLLQQPVVLDYLISRNNQFNRGAGENFLKSEHIELYREAILDNIRLQQKSYAAALESLPPLSSGAAAQSSAQPVPDPGLLRQQWEAQKQAELQQLRTQHTEQNSKSTAQYQQQLQHELQQLQQRLDAEKAAAVVVAAEVTEKARAEMAEHIATVQDLNHQIQQLQAQIPRVPAFAPHPIPARIIPAPEQKEPPLSPRALQHFLRLVAEGEQDQAEGLLRATPALALSAAPVTDLSGRRFANITAFQYAIWAVDWHMWTMLLKYLPRPQARVQIQTLQQHGTEHGISAHSLIETLIQALDTHVKNYNAWDSEGSPCSKLIHQWSVVIGTAQRNCPIHIINEYCHPNRSFDPVPSFVDALPRSRKDYQGNDVLTVIYNSGKLGEKFALYRADVLWVCKWVLSGGRRWPTSVRSKNV